MSRRCTPEDRRDLSPKSPSTTKTLSFSERSRNHLPTVVAELEGWGPPRCRKEGCVNERRTGGVLRPPLRFYEGDGPPRLHRKGGGRRGRNGHSVTVLPPIPRTLGRCETPSRPHVQLIFLCVPVTSTSLFYHFYVLYHP